VSEELRELDTAGESLMTTYNLPTHQATSTSALTVTVAGLHSRLHFITAPSSTTVYVRGDGTAAVSAADNNYPVFPSPDEGTCVPVSGGTLTGGTSFSVIAASGTPVVSVLKCECDSGF
jgi:hypothetical protein